MTDELTPTQMLAYPELYPIRGGAEDEDSNAVETPDTSSDSEDAASSEDESFTDSFNPDEMPEEARTAYEAAYKKMQGDYTRKTQSLAEQRQEAEQAVALVEALQDPNQRDIALQLLGVETNPVEELDDDVDEDDPEYRLERLEAALSAQAEQAQFAELEELEDQYLDNKFQELRERHGEDFTDEELELLYLTATHPQFRDNRGMPDTDAAYERVIGVEKLAQSKHVKSKSAAKPPYGSPGSKTVDLSDDDARINAMAEIIDASEATDD